MKLFVPLTSKNERYKTIRYGINRLVKVEKSIEDKLRRQAKRYNKTYPGEMLHVDTKRLPLLKNETKQQTREYLPINIHLIFIVFIHKRSTFLKLFDKNGAVFVC
ncbi:Mobile element protein [Gilliamella apicola]|nr:Mobile element protein [Gilliamella apicola]